MATSFISGKPQPGFLDGDAVRRQRRAVGFHLRRVGADQFLLPAVQPVGVVVDHHPAVILLEGEVSEPLKVDGTAKRSHG